MPYLLLLLLHSTACCQLSPPALDLLSVFPAQSHRTAPLLAADVLSNQKEVCDHPLTSSRSLGRASNVGQSQDRVQWVRLASEEPESSNLCSRAVQLEHRGVLKGINGIVTEDLFFLVT